MKESVSRSAVVDEELVDDVVPVVSTVFVTLVTDMVPPYARASKNEPKSCCSAVSPSPASLCCFCCLFPCVS